VVLLRSVASSPAQLVRLPLASNRAIVGLLGGASEPTSEPASSEPPTAVWEVPTSTAQEAGGSDDARMARVRELLRRRTTQNEIIREVWGTTGGRRYQEAADELRDLVSKMV
jgi:hypothetical protein